MDLSHTDEEAASDHSAAVHLEIDAQLAGEIDEALQTFAEQAEVETVLLVEKSGALVTGVSAEPDVKIEVISALVAGVAGTMKALVSELGGEGEIESLQQGGERVLYLREIIGRFILVGVCGTSTPVGIIRENARQIEPTLERLLGGVESLPMPKGPVRPEPKSLRSDPSAPVVVSVPIAEVIVDDEISETIPVSDTEEDDSSPEVEEDESEEVASESEEEIDSDLAGAEVEEEIEQLEPEEDIEEEADEPDTEEIEVKGPVIGALSDEWVAEPAPASEEPREVIEFLGNDEPEIVIDSQEEEEPEEELAEEVVADELLDEAPPEDEEVPEESAVTESIFELAEDEDEDDEVLAEDEEISAEETAPVEALEPPPLLAEPSTEVVFELDESDIEEEADDDDEIAEGPDELPKEEPVSRPFYL